MQWILTVHKKHHIFIIQKIRGFPTIFKLGPGSVQLGKLTCKIFKFAKFEKLSS
jgi:hypothetical protein